MFPLVKSSSNFAAAACNCAIVASPSNRGCDITHSLDHRKVPHALVKYLRHVMAGGYYSQYSLADYTSSDLFICDNHRVQILNRRVCVNCRKSFKNESNIIRLLSSCHTIKHLFHLFPVPLQLEHDHICSNCRHCIEKLNDKNNLNLHRTVSSYGLNDISNTFNPLILSSTSSSSSQSSVRMLSQSIAFSPVRDLPCEDRVPITFNINSNTITTNQLIPKTMPTFPVF